MTKPKDDLIGNPSPWTFRFLRWFCPDYIYEEIEGDLIQKLKWMLYLITPLNRSKNSLGEMIGIFSI